MEIETYRTRKGFVVFDSAAGLYVVHVRRPGSSPPDYFVPEEGEVRDEGLAITLLKDYPVEG